MTEIMISIRPQWVQKILSGEKTVEVRKSAPPPPFRAFVYCTKGGKFFRSDTLVTDASGEPYGRYDYPVIIKARRHI